MNSKPHPDELSQSMSAALTSLTQQFKNLGFMVIAVKEDAELVSCKTASNIDPSSYGDLFGLVLENADQATVISGKVN